MTEPRGAPLPMHYLIFIVGFRSRGTLEEVARRVSRCILGGAEFDFENTDFYDEVPAVRLRSPLLGFDVRIQQGRDEEFFLEGYPEAFAPEWHEADPSEPANTDISRHIEIALLAGGFSIIRDDDPAERGMPGSLIAAIELCKSSLAGEENSDLKLGCRQLIWSELGPRLDSRDFPRNPGLRRRVHLAMLATEKVLPIWSASAEEGSLPQEILAGVHAYLDCRCDYEDLKEFIRQGERYFDREVNSEQGYRVALEVLNAALNTARFALFDAPFDAAHLDPTSDDVVDPEEIDPAVYAAGAFSGGGEWNPESDPLRRRAFWEWYLDEAVPAAWSAVP